MFWKGCHAARLLLLLCRFSVASDCLASISRLVEIHGINGRSVSSLCLGFCADMDVESSLAVGKRGAFLPVGGFSRLLLLVLLVCHGPRNNVRQKFEVLDARDGICCEIVSSTGPDGPLNDAPLTDVSILDIPPGFAFCFDDVV